MSADVCLDEWSGTGAAGAGATIAEDFDFLFCDFAHFSISWVIKAARVSESLNYKWLPLRVIVNYKMWEASFYKKVLNP